MLQATLCTKTAILLQAMLMHEGTKSPVEEGHHGPLVRRTGWKTTFAEVVRAVIEWQKIASLIGCGSILETEYSVLPGAQVYTMVARKNSCTGIHQTQSFKFACTSC